jgi:GNAT superfamily N-acetyltransferase
VTDNTQHGPVTVELIQLSDSGHRAALVDLLDQYAQDPMGGGEGLPDSTRSVLADSLRARNDYVGLLAFEAGQAIGLANCFEGFSTFAARPLLNIHDLVVRREHRGRGVGRQLLTAIEAEARRRGCCKLTLEVLSDNRTAIASYERFGFVAYQLQPNAGHALFYEKKLVGKGGEAPGS